MRRLLALAPLLIALLPGEPRGANLAEGLDVGAETELHWAVGTGSGRTQQAELIVQPRIEVDLLESLSFTAIGRLRSDLVDELEPGNPTPREVSRLSRRALLGDRSEAELRELYLRARLGRAYLTLGKQQVVWGTADGLKVLDVVNPQDFREFILDDFEDSRIPLWTANLEVPVRGVDVQLLWIPDPSYHEIPDGGRMSIANTPIPARSGLPASLYAFTAERFRPSAPPGVRLRVREVDRPRRIVSDSDAGVRLRKLVGGWDLTLNYLYHYDDIPVPFRRLVLQPAGVFVPLVIPVVEVTPRYERTHLVGTTFSNAFGDLTVRGEVGYSTDRFSPVADLADPDGVVETGELSYVLGLDWYRFAETLLSVQVFQSWLTENPRGLLRDRAETTLSFLARRELWNDRLAIQLFLLHGTNRHDGLVRGELSYEVGPGLVLRVGADHFYGSRNGLFGQFDRNDRATVSLEWSI